LLTSIVQVVSPPFPVSLHAETETCGKKSSGVTPRRIAASVRPMSCGPPQGRTFIRGDSADPQDVGRTLAAMRRGVTPDDYLPRVSVSAWSETGNGGLTTWTIEVSKDA